MIGVGRRVLVGLLVVGLALGSTACASVEEQRAELRESLEGPQLAVLDLAEAAETGDVTGVRTHMDSSAVAVAFARATMARARADDEPGSSSSHGEELPLGKMEETFAEGFTNSIVAGVESGTVVADGTLLAAVLRDGPGPVEYISENEALVSVDLAAAEGEESLSANLRMARTGDRWMLIAVEDTTDLLGLFFGKAR